MVQCFDKLSHQRQVSKKKQQVAMFQRSISIDTHRSNQLSHPTSDSSMSTSPAAASTASVVTPLGLASPPTGPQQSTSPLDNNSNQASVTVSNANSVVHHSIPSYESVSSANLSRSSSIVSAVVENSSLHSHHLVPMYANGANTLFGTNNSAPSTLVMTPPSPYSSDMSPSIMGTDSSSLMQHPSWYHTTMRTQHPSYPEMIGGDWSNPVCANTGFTNSASSPLSACAYQMSLPGAYSSSISSVYHPHHGGCRPEQAETAFYHQRFNASYPHNSYYPHAFFNSTGSPTGPTNHSFPPLSVGTSEMNQMSFATSALLNSSPDSGLTVSSEGNESPSLASHVAESHGAMLAANLTSASLLNAGRSHQALSAHADLDEDIKPNIGQHGPGGQQQEATSTTSNSSNGTSNVSNHLGMYNWMKKSTNSSSSQSSTGKTRTKDKYRVVYTETQRVELEKEFHFSRYITIKRKSELACQLMLSERQVKIWFQNRRAKDRKQQRKRDEMLKKEKKDNTAAVVVSNHSAGGGLLSQGSVTPGVLVVSNSGLGNSCSSSANQLLVTSVTGSTIHHHTPPHQGQSRHSAPSHSVAVVAPTHHFSTQAPPGTVHHSLHSAQTGTIIHSGSTYRDILSGTISQMTATTPTVVSEIAH